MFSVILHLAWLIIQAFIGVSVLMPVFFYFVYCINQFTRKQLPVDEELHEEKDYAIVISVHGQTETVQPLLESLLQLNYSNYLIYVVVNNNNITNISFNSDRIVVLQTVKAFHSPVRLHRFAIENFKRSHTHVTILDDTSIIDKEYLNNLNICFHQGYQAVQSQCNLKNNNSAYDIIQSTGNLYRNFFTGELSFALGSSAILTGSGMAFSIRLYKQCLKKIEVTDTNFVTTLQKVIVKSGNQIAFARYAIVYDGKTIHGHELMQQHARNMNTWLRQFTSYCKLIGKGMLAGNMNQFLSGIFLIRLPLFTNLLASVFCFFISIWISPVTAIAWAGCLLSFPLSILMATVHANPYGNQETGMEESDNDSLFPAISLYEDTEDDYNITAQTV